MKSSSQGSRNTQMKLTFEDLNCGWDLTGKREVRKALCQWRELPGDRSRAVARQGSLLLGSGKHGGVFVKNLWQTAVQGRMHPNCKGSWISAEFRGRRNPLKVSEQDCYNQGCPWGRLASKQHKTALQAKSPQEWAITFTEARASEVCCDCGGKGDNR